jgi:hypothetical protein
MWRSNLFKFYMMLLCGVLLQSCSIKEDISDCRYLLINYDYHLEEEEMTDADFTKEIDYIKVYIFDKNRKFLNLMLVKSQLLEHYGYVINVPESYNGNTMVAWAHENNECYDTPSMNVGDDISKLTLRLKTDLDASGKESNINTKEIANLFYGGEELIRFTENGNAHVINFMRMNKVMNIDLISGKNDIDVEKYDIYLTAKNGHYLTNNDIVPTSEIITYKPINQVVATRSDHTNRAEVHSLRLLYNTPATLKIINKETGKPVTFAGAEELDIIEHILHLKPTGMSAQEYLDKQSDWAITFDIDDVKNSALSIKIHDWIKWFDGGSMGR